MKKCLWVHSYSVELHRSNHQICSKKNGVLTNFAFFFNKVEGLRSEISGQFKNIYFEEHLWKTASGCMMENHVEIEPQRACFEPVFFTLTFLWLVFFPSFTIFFIGICLGFDESKLTKGKLWKNLAGSIIQLQRTRLNFQTGQTNMATWHLQINFSTYWVILMTIKTGYKICNSKSDVCLCKFREV